MYAYIVYIKHGRNSTCSLTRLVIGGVCSSLCLLISSSSSFKENLVWSWWSFCIPDILGGGPKMAASWAACICASLLAFTNHESNPCKDQLNQQLLKEINATNHYEAYTWLADDKRVLPVFWRNSVSSRAPVPSGNITSHWQDKQELDKDFDAKMIQWKNQPPK